MNYSRFNITDDHSFNIALAIDYCKKNNIDTLTFDKGVYVLRPERASESVLSISNHNVHGFVSIAMLLEDMDGFTIDGGGSTFISDGVMTASAIIGSKNICLKNLSLEVKGHLRMEAIVTEHGDNSFTARITNGNIALLKERVACGWFRD